MKENVQASWVVTPTTRVSKILERSGDLAEVLEAFGSRREFLGRFPTVERAARVHGVPGAQLLNWLDQPQASA